MHSAPVESQVEVPIVVGIPLEPQTMPPKLWVSESERKKAGAAKFVQVATIPRNPVLDLNTVNI